MFYSLYPVTSCCALAPDLVSILSLAVRQSLGYLYSEPADPTEIKLFGDTTRSENVTLPDRLSYSLIMTLLKYTNDIPVVMAITPFHPSSSNDKKISFL